MNNFSKLFNILLITAATSQVFADSLDSIIGNDFRNLKLKNGESVLYVKESVFKRAPSDARGTTQNFARIIRSLDSQGRAKVSFDCATIDARGIVDRSEFKSLVGKEFSTDSLKNITKVERERVSKRYTLGDSLSDAQYEYGILGMVPAALGEYFTRGITNTISGKKVTKNLDKITSMCEKGKQCAVPGTDKAAAVISINSSKTSSVCDLMKENLNYQTQGSSGQASANGRHR